jgi:hypothetical protein
MLFLSSSWLYVDRCLLLLRIHHHSLKEQALARSTYACDLVCLVYTGRDRELAHLAEDLLLRW